MNQFVERVASEQPPLSRVDEIIRSKLDDADQAPEDFQNWSVDPYGSEKGGGFVRDEPIRFEAPKEYDDRVDHMIAFFNGIRTGSPILEDAAFGLRAAAPSIACTLSIAKEKPILWDPIGMKLV